MTDQNTYDDITLRPSAQGDDKTIANLDRTIANLDKTIANLDKPMDKTIAHSDMPMDKTIVAGGIVQPSPMADAVDDPTIRTLRPDDGGMLGAAVAMDGNVFMLKGVAYRQIKCLSESSGEAQVFIVCREGESTEYVLKVYYPNFNVNKKLLQVIRSFRFEMIVRLIDFGKTYVDAKNRYYELMEYLRGGTLYDYQLGGDFKQFRRLALQGAAALAYCHRHNILHKDIKPGNFFFRNERHKELVLGDFGISTLLEREGKPIRTTQARTPLYAAPEMYSDVIDGEVEITPAADFYSLGMTLFACWLGENPMSANERTMMRQKNEGRLPRLNELPESVRTIVMGLTVVNPLRRWGYDEVERWFLGEDVAVDASSPILRYKTFVVDPDRNIVADNVQELVPLLLEHDRAAMNYLYSGRIAEWLETCGNQKLATAVKDVTTNRYPVDKKSGLLTAAYIMDPTYPYIDVQGNKCDDVHSIALSLLSNQEKYSIVLQNPNDALFLWIETHTQKDIGRLRSYFAVGANLQVAVMRLVYEIDEELPFMANNPSGSIKEIVYSFGHSLPTDDDWHSLTDGRLLSWMHSHEDVMACESLRILTENKPYSQSLAYKVLYNLDREAAYDLCEASTPQKVGEYIASKLVVSQHLSDAEVDASFKEITDPDGRFHYFAQLHGWYQQIEEAKHCFDLKSEENRNRLGVYDLRTALYRFCRILGATPKYVLPNGQELTDGCAIPDSATSEITNEVRRGAFPQWLSVFFHEDPNRDFSEQYSYERELVEWLITVGRYDSQFRYYRRYVKACDETKERVAYVRSQWRHAYSRERLWRYTFYAVCAVWIALVAVCGFPNTGYFMEHPYLTVMLPVGGVCGLIMMSRAYFKGYGATISALWGSAGVLSSLIPIYILKTVATTWPGLFSVAVILLTLLYLGICHLTDFRNDSHSDDSAVKDLLNVDDVNTSLLDPLYYTFRTKSSHYQSAKFGVLDDIDNQVHSISGESVIHYALWCLMALLMAVQFVLFSPKLLNLNIPGEAGSQVTSVQHTETEQDVTE